MANRKVIEQELQYEEMYGYTEEALTDYGLALRMLRESRKDAKDWMAKYKIEAELCEKAEKELERQRCDNSKIAAQRDRAERKNRLLASCIATLIDSEEFV